MSNKQTAMQELIEWLEEVDAPTGIIKKAKSLLDIEKQNLINAFWHGDNSDCTSEENAYQFAICYYNNTYQQD